MNTLYLLFDALIHLDTHLFAFVTDYGPIAYLLLFAIIFCETAFIILPFLPGDSLLFAAGSIAASTNNAFSIQVLLLSLMIASILGNKLNYFIGRSIGPKVFSAKHSFLLNKKHLQEAHVFYEKHGGKTIILARFIPIIRTFAPFVAGVGNMSIRRFSYYNLISGALWIGSLLGAGYFLGSIPFIQNHFSFVVYSIIIISIAPTVILYWMRRNQ